MFLPWCAFQNLCQPDGGRRAASTTPRIKLYPGFSLFYFQGGTFSCYEHDKTGNSRPTPHRPRLSPSQVHLGRGWQVKCRSQATSAEASLAQKKHGAGQLPASPHSTGGWAGSLQAFGFVSGGRTNMSAWPWQKLRKNVESIAAWRRNSAVPSACTGALCHSAVVTAVSSASRRRLVPRSSPRPCTPALCVRSSWAHPGAARGLPAVQQHGDVSGHQREMGQGLQKVFGARSLS